MKKMFFLAGILIALMLVAACKPACAEDLDSLKPEIAYRLLDKNDNYTKKHRIDLQFYSPYADWRTDTDFNRYRYLWGAVKHFEKLNPTCAFGAIESKVDEAANRFTIDVWCIDYKSKSKI